MKLSALAIMAMGLTRLAVISVAFFMDKGTALERVDDRFDALVIFVLGAILWQLTIIKNNRQ